MVLEQTGSVFECASCNKLITNQYADIIIRNKNLEPCEKYKGSNSVIIDSTKSYQEILF